MPSPDETRSGAWPLFVGAYSFFVVMAGATVPTPLYPIYAEVYGFPPFIITVIFAVYSVGVIGALLTTGPWSDEIGRKPLLLGGLVAAALSLVIFAVAQGLWLLLLARFLQGVSVGIYAAAATVAVTEMGPDDRPHLSSVLSTVANMGGLGTGSILGALVLVLLPAPLVSPYLVQLALVAIGLALLWSVAEPNPPAEDPELRVQGLAVPQEVRGVMVPAAISAFAGFMVCGFLGAVAPSFLGKVLGHDGEHLLIGFAAGLIFLTSCISQVFEEAIPDRVVLPLGMGLLAVGIAGITAAIWAQSLWAFLATVGFTGLGHGIAFKGGLSAVSEAAPEDQVSAVTATYFTVAYVAISIPVLVIGATQEAFGLHLVATLYGAVSAVLSVVAFVLILRRG